MSAALVFRNHYPELCDAFDYNVIDTMGDEFDNTFHSWPVRYWFVGEGGKIEFKAMPNDSVYDVNTLECFLKGRFA